MTIFVTGATGYIGSVVAERLRLDGYDVVGLARSSESERRLAEQGIRVLRGDLSDPDCLRRGARGADAVIHLATTGAEDAAEVDEGAVRAMLDVLVGSGKPFIYTSGVWVLGNTGDRPADEEAPVDPTPLVAWRPGVERLVLASASEGVRGVVLRPAIVYGRGGGIPGMLVASGREHGMVRYVGDGEQRWPFVHVDDLADLYVRALDAPPGTLLHGAAGPSYRVRDVAEAASHAAGLPGKEESLPLEEARKELGTFADALALDQRVSGERAHTLLGWEPQAPSVLDDLKHGSYASAGAVPTHHVCVTCGVQFAATEEPPATCPICADERQYVGLNGQQWTTLEALRKTHRNVVRTLEPDLAEIYTEPTFAIGQRALLVGTAEGNVLWDCVTLIDEETVRAVEERGGVSAIAVSHPHYYSSVVEWSRAFGDVPVYIHAADRRWVARPDSAIVFWEGDTIEVAGGLTLIRTGGHFEGSTVLHWPSGAGGRGVLLTGDSMKVAMDRRHVSFMYSYPNHIPLSGDQVEEIVRSVEPFAYDRIYGAWHGHQIRTAAKTAVRRSAERYLRALHATASAI